MADVARVLNFVPIGLLGCYKPKRVGVDKSARWAFRFDRRHVAGNALVPCAAVLVVGVLLKSGGMRTVRRRGAVAVQTELGWWFPELRVISRAVHVMTIETGYPASVHDALHEIVALHAVLVRGAIGEIIEISKLAKRVAFQLPEILQIQPQ